MPKVVVYSSPTCTYCQVIKIFLKKHNVSFEEVDILEDDAKRKELLEKTGTETVPVVFVGEKFVAGYDRKKLQELLGI